MRAMRTVEEQALTIEAQDIALGYEKAPAQLDCDGGFWYQKVASNRIPCPRASHMETTSDIVEALCRTN